MLSRPSVVNLRFRFLPFALCTSPAEGYLELGQPAFALAELRRRGKLIHGNAHGCYLMGECLRELQNYADAIYPLARSAALEPQHLAVWLALGWCYKRTGQLQRAIDALEQGLDHEPREAVLHYNLACYWSLARQRDRALDCLSHALELDVAYRALIDDEPDFDPLRNDPEFRSITGVIV